MQSIIIVQFRREQNVEETVSHVPSGMVWPMTKYGYGLLWQFEKSK